MKTSVPRSCRLPDTGRYAAPTLIQWQAAALEGGKQALTAQLEGISFFALFFIFIVICQVRFYKYEFSSYFVRIALQLMFIKLARKVGHVYLSGKSGG
jgi:hypothetical protein